MRQLYITEKLLEKYGKTPGRPKCEEYGVDHSAECRQRIEKAMIDAGEAFEMGGKQRRANGDSTSTNTSTES